jgi:hypothetical protein
MLLIEALARPLRHDNNCGVIVGGCAVIEEKLVTQCRLEEVGLLVNAIKVDRDEDVEQE